MHGPPEPARDRDRRACIPVNLPTLSIGSISVPVALLQQNEAYACGAALAAHLLAGA